MDPVIESGSTEECFEYLRNFCESIPAWELVRRKLQFLDAPCYQDQSLGRNELTHGESNVEQEGRFSLDSRIFSVSNKETI